VNGKFTATHKDIISDTYVEMPQNVFFPPWCNSP